MKYGQLIFGPAGSGKTTYCRTLQLHGELIKRNFNIVNLDPAAEDLIYPCDIDIRHVVPPINEIMATEAIGPNGALMYAMECFLAKMDWLEDQIREFPDDSYFLFDCPGQIELYTHNTVMTNIVQSLQALDVRLCGVCCLDVAFLDDDAKLLSGSLLALSTMIRLELPHLNMLTKCDLLLEESAAYHQFQNSKTAQCVYFNSEAVDEDPSFTDSMEVKEAHLDTLLHREPEQLLAGIRKSMPPRYLQLNEAFCQLLQDYNLVSFLPFNPSDEESIRTALLLIDSHLQYGEDLEVTGDYDMHQENM